MDKDTVYGEVKRWAVIAVAVALIGVISASVRSDSYSKPETDRETTRIETQHNRDIDRVYDGIDQIQQNVDWLVRQQGGEPLRGGTEEDR